ncbi:TlpA family protein disulfide reductase [Jannaschia aquimarina]|uniref:TlpA protein n=1 Tax=Jannaschia aquimarina TaxID=935700 RepID=A0A0D1EFK2_9RHOB|nr:TlpA disulfide reductase family protein [Jannaschia aquimarina]KIT16429.1 Thiol:disulfide interchange protein TlpA [Jannaschia aquimarina]SNS92101.1 Thiol-disulfide isomerase or thioredoxin [Jannaschia aquimarina]
MRILLSVAAYTAALALATPAVAGQAEGRAEAEARGVEMDFPAPFPPEVTAYQTFEGEAADLSDHAGQVVVLNFWATWCAPCRAEMPSLQTLDETVDGEGIDVVTMAFGRHNPAAMKMFWEEAGITSLPLHRDVSTDLARGLGVKGLPHTVVLGADGRVIASKQGEADWASEDMLAVIRALAD